MASLLTLPPPTILATATALSGAAWLAIRVHSDYRRWLRLGRARLPHNFLGYSVQTAMRLVATETRSVAVYSDPTVVQKYTPEGRVSYLKGPLPVRQGERPALEPFVVPQRQSQGNPEYIRELQHALVASIAKEHSEAASIGISILENGGPALFLSEHSAPPDWLRGTHGEILHIHQSEGSMHCCMSLEDAREVIEKGWGERLSLCGAAGPFCMPYSFVLLYAPRDIEELLVVKTIVRAGFRACTAGQNMKV